MLGGVGGKVSRPCARLLTTCKMLPPSLATSALIQELSLCHRLCPTRGHCRTPSGIWHLPDPCSHTRHCGIRDNRGQRLGAGQASASTSPKRTAPPTATTSARGGGDGSSRLPRHMLAWTRRGAFPYARRQARSSDRPVSIRPLRGNQHGSSRVSARRPHVNTLGLGSFAVNSRRPTVVTPSAPFSVFLSGNLLPGCCPQTRIVI